jgi:choline dehydrogenase-like flavoprotein
VDVSGLGRFTVPGAPLPVPHPDLVGEALRRHGADLEDLVPLVLGDVAGWAYGEIRGAPAELVQLRPRIEQAPNRDSRVVLADERDALGVRRARLDWRMTPLDRHSTRRTLEIVAAEIGRAGLGRVRITFEEGGDSWPEDIEGGRHHTGTTRMSDDPRRGVVDPNLRVHGIDNLYVGGSSVFPTCGRGTPTFTLVALALRLAEHLKGVLT